MPGHLLHENAMVQCAHAPGQANPTQTDRRVKVSGQNIVTQAAPYTISGCSLPPPSAGNGPCVTANWTQRCNPGQERVVSRCCSQTARPFVPQPARA